MTDLTDQETTSPAGELDPTAAADGTGADTGGAGPDGAGGTGRAVDGAGAEAAGDGAVAPTADETSGGLPDDVSDQEADGSAGDVEAAGAGDGPVDEAAAEADDDTDAVPAAGTGSTRPSRAAVLEREGEVAADFLERLLDIADLDGDIDVDIEGDRASIAIVDSEEGRVPRRLVGTDGKVLEALQELTRLAVQAATGERSRLMLDVAGHRAARRTELVAVARDAIEAVRGGGDRVALTPMSAFERKVVHDQVLAAGLASESEGVEPHRFVVVLPV